MTRASVPAVCNEAPPVGDCGAFPNLESTLAAEPTQAAASARRRRLYGDLVPIDTRTGMALADSVVRWIAYLDSWGAAPVDCPTTTPLGRELDRIERAIRSTIRALELRVYDPAPLDLVRERAFATDPRVAGCEETPSDPRLEALTFHCFAMGRARDDWRIVPSHALGCARFRTRGFRFAEAGRSARTHRSASYQALVVDGDWRCERWPESPSDCLDSEYGRERRARGASYCDELAALRLPYEERAVIDVDYQCGSLCGDMSEHLVVRIGGRWRYIGEEHTGSI